VLVICGAGDGKVLRALDSVGLLDQPDVETFVTFNDAMECRSAYRPCAPMETLISTRRDGERVSTCLVRFEWRRDETCR
jgi:hypothetical protein